MWKNPTFYKLSSYRDPGAIEADPGSLQWEADRRTKLVYRKERKCFWFCWLLCLHIWCFLVTDHLVFRAWLQVLAQAICYRGNMWSWTVWPEFSLEERPWVVGGVCFCTWTIKITEDNQYLEVYSYQFLEICNPRPQ